MGGDFKYKMQLKRRLAMNMKKERLSRKDFLKRHLELRVDETQGISQMKRRDEAFHSGNSLGKAWKQGEAHLAGESEQMEISGTEGEGKEMEEMSQRVKEMICKLRSLDFVLRDVESLQTFMQRNDMIPLASEKDCCVILWVERGSQVNRLWILLKQERMKS